VSLIRFFAGIGILLKMDFHQSASLLSPKPFGHCEPRPVGAWQSPGQILNSKHEILHNLKAPMTKTGGDKPRPYDRAQA